MIGRWVGTCKNAHGKNVRQVDVEDCIEKWTMLMTGLEIERVIYMRVRAFKAGEGHKCNNDTAW